MQLQLAMPPGQRLGRIFFVITALFWLVGCGAQDKSKVKVAEVGDRTITLDYFERKMNTMDPQYVPEDIDTVEGRKELLEVMINKEVMAIKAEELGMDADGKADEQAEAVAMLKAVNRMREAVTAPAQQVTEDQIYDYYENLARILDVSYMLFDHEEQAWEGKRLIEGGEAWRTVATRMEAGDPGPNKDWTLQMKYGTVADDLEQIVFELPVGEISDPIDSIYGYFVIRVDSQTIDRLPPLDTIRDKIMASVRKQNSALLIRRYIDKVFEDYHFTLNEAALDTLFAALPPDVELMPPPPREDLLPLKLSPTNLDMPLMSYADQKWDLRRYYDFYNESGALGRPRHDRRLGGLRRMLKEIAIRELMPIAARDNGYFEDPVVQDELKERREQAMVTKLHDELVRGEVTVSPEEVQTYWDEHSGDFIRPERRELLAVVAGTELDGQAVQLEALNGVDWDDLVEKYCIEGEVKQKKGKMGSFKKDDVGPFAEVGFQLPGDGEVSYPREIGEGQWLVVKVAGVTPRYEPTFAEMKVRIGRIIESQKEEELFQKRVQEWKSTLSIRRHPEQLMKAVYDPRPRPGQTGIPAMPSAS